MKIENWLPMEAGGVKRRPGFKYVGECPAGERIVSMIEFNNTIYVATNKTVFVMRDEKLHPVMFVEPTEGMVIGTERKDNGPD